MSRSLFIILLALLAPASQAQEIRLRHAQEGAALDALASLTLRFNDAQKGKAKVVLEDLAGIEDKHRLPQLALLDAADAVRFFGTRPRFKPLADAMKEGGEKFEPQRFYPQAANAVDDLAGRIQALPLGLSLPVLFINRDAFRKAGLDPERPPQTWWEVQKTAGDLFDAGSKCPLTSSYFAWVHVENLSSQHGEPVVGGSGRNRKLAINSLANVKHIALLSSWYKSHYFRYFGPGDEGDARFASGECAMLTGESSAYKRFAAGGFEVGVAALPHYDDVYGAVPGNVLADGAALWVTQNVRKDEAKVVARFAAFLLRPENQKEWVKATGYLPMTPVAVDAFAASGMPAAVVAEARKRLTAAKSDGRPRNGVGRGRIREILDEEIAFVWQNAKPAKEALDTAVLRADAWLAPAYAAAAKK